RGFLQYAQMQEMTKLLDQYGGPTKLGPEVQRFGQLPAPMLAHARNKKPGVKEGLDDAPPPTNPPSPASGFVKGAPPAPPTRGRRGGETGRRVGRRDQGRPRSPSSSRRPRGWAGADRRRRGGREPGRHPSGHRLPAGRPLPPGGGLRRPRGAPGVGHGPVRRA